MGPPLTAFAAPSVLGSLAVLGKIGDVEHFLLVARVEVHVAAGRVVGCRAQSRSGYTHPGAGDSSDRVHRGDCVLRALSCSLNFSVATCRVDV